MIKIAYILEQNKLDRIKSLQTLYHDDRIAFLRQVAPRMKFAYNIAGHTKGSYRMKYNADYSLIEANPKDLIAHTEDIMRVQPLHLSSENHIRIGTGIESRVFGIAAHLLSGGHIDAPNIHVNDYREVVFGDGRHRTALAADCMIRSIPVVIDNEGLDNLERFKLFRFTVLIDNR